MPQLGLPWLDSPWLGPHPPERRRRCAPSAAAAMPPRLVCYCGDAAAPRSAAVVMPPRLDLLRRRCRGASACCCGDAAAFRSAAAAMPPHLVCCGGNAATPRPRLRRCRHASSAAAAMPPRLVRCCGDAAAPRPAAAAMPPRLGPCVPFTASLDTRRVAKRSLDERALAWGLAGD